LVEHLIGLGRHPIAFIGGPPKNEDSQWRECGYRAALAAAGLPIDERLSVSGGFTETGGTAAIAQMLESGVTFRAVFAANDEMALGAFLALKAANLRVPEDVAVVGFDDIAVARFVAPPLTTVRAPIEQLGQAAAQLLLDAIRGEKLPSEQILLPVELVVRGSCGSRKAGS
jgi:DNA-binding LacI/PurR family transcriptional regulator